MTDIEETLRRLKPGATVVPAGLDRLLSAVALEPRRTQRRPRVVMAVALLTAGIAVTAATGMLPRTFTESLSFWNAESGGAVSAGNGRRVAQQPGPDGRVLTVWSAGRAGGVTCVTALFEAPGPLDRPAPADFHSAGGQCTSPDVPGSFGDLGGSATPEGVHTMWGPAGEAVRAELRLADGTERPALSAAGMFFCWYTAAEAPTLVGYDADGAVVGRHPMHVMGPPPR